MFVRFQKIVYNKFVKTDKDSAKNMIEFDEKILQKLQSAKQKYDDINQKLLLEEVLIDSKLTINLQKQRAKLEPLVTEFENLKSQEQELQNLTNDEQVAFANEVEQINQKIELSKDKILSLLANFDTQMQSVCIEFLPCDNISTNFCKDIFDSIKKFCQKNNFDFEEDVQDKLAFVTGQNAQNLFASLNGMHKNLTTNQTVLLTIFPKIERKIAKFGENDLKINIFRSNGAGGQNVNKLSTAVRITHIATNIVATCQDERSQFQNRQKALENLKQKVNQKLQNDFLSQKSKLEKLYKNQNIVCTYDYAGFVTSTKSNAKVLSKIFLQGDIANFLNQNMLEK